MPPKTSSRIKNKKLTDFFHHPSSVPSSTAPSAPTEKASTTTTSGSRIQTRLLTRASKTMTEDERSTRSVPPQNRSVSTASRKRARSPDAPIDLTQSPVPSPPRRRSPKKRMRVFGTDPDVEKPTAVAYVTSPFRNGSTQKPATPQVHSNTLLVTSPTDSGNQVVYSSQSDEAELVLPTPESRDLGKVVEGVHTWRQKTFQASTPSPLRAREDAMDMDASSSSPLRSSPLTGGQSSPLRLVGTTKRSSTPPQTPHDVSTCLPSPPNSKELLPLPPTPKQLDPETKTAKIIAEIQARARAAAFSSDDEETLVYRELEVSDDDDDEIMGALPLIGGSKRPSALYPAPRMMDDVFSSPLSSVPSAFNDATMSPSTSSDRCSPPARRSLRTRELAPSFRLPKVAAGPSTSVGVTKCGSSSNHKKSWAKNPLQALLREKELQDKRGTDDAAFRRAEEAVRQVSRETSVGSNDDLDTMDQLSLTDEQAAWRAVYESRKSTSPDDASDLEDFTVGEREAKMLGSGAGAAINKILVGDRCNKGKAKTVTNQEAASGVALWVRPADTDMAVDLVSIPPLSGHPILTCLDESLRSGDNSLVNLVLCTGALAVIPPEILILNMPHILIMTLFGSPQVSNAVSIALRDLWGLNPRAVYMPFTAISFALVQLGASPSILKELGLSGELPEERKVNHVILLEALRRLLAIVKAAAFAGAFSSEDIANVVLSLVFIGLDPLTSDDLQTHLNITMDVVCNHGASDHLLDAVHERVLNFAAQLAPVDRVRLVSFFASGGGRTRRIARHLAYSLLVSEPMSPKDKVPSLESLILLLSPEAGSCEPFDVTNESTDYETLSHHVYLLSVALNDLAPYVEEERSINMIASTSIQGSPGKPKKPTVPPLELLCKVLELLQSKIVDTRAAHLDRSRTKAAIQRLTMRIRYDRMALIGHRPRQRASTLKAYFSPQRR